MAKKELLTIYIRQELDKKYPAITVPKAIDTEDPFIHRSDDLETTGISDAERIAAEAREHGRKRYTKGKVHTDREGIG